MSTDLAALYRLLGWLSPSFPVGAFTFSHGLEHAIHTHDVRDRDSAEAWLDALVSMGSGQADLVLVAAGWHAPATTVAAVADEGRAYAATAELRLETLAQGDAFITAILASWPCAAATRLEQLGPGRVPYPIAVGHVARDHDIGLEPVLTGYAHAFVANAVSAVVRAVPLGQSDGQRILASLETTVATAVRRALATPLAELASTTPRSDIGSMRHERQYTRLFRS